MRANLGDIDPQRIEALLRTQRYGRSLRVLPSTESTNDDAKRDALGGAPDGHVVLADAQSKGRGSHGRVWASPAGSDVYLSIVARPELPLAALPPLTLAVGLGVAEAVELLLGRDAPSRAQVKWPNDVWLGGKKCAGILVETSTAVALPDVAAVIPAVVIGIGLNVNRSDFPAELGAATSLRAAVPGRRALDRAQAVAAVLQRVEHWVDRFVHEGGAAIAHALAPRLALRGARVRCDEVEGVLIGVAESGAVQIATDSGVRELLAGRITPLS